MTSPESEENLAPEPLPRPTWHVPQERRGRKEMTIHVPLDGSKEATAALPVAAEIARLTGAAIHIVHVGKTAVRPEDLLDRLSLQPEQFLGSTVDVCTGDPAEAIVRSARDHNSLAIVMTTHAGTQSPEALGPVAAAVVQDARFPILFVRPGTRLELPFRRILLPLDGTPSAAAAITPAADLAYRSGASLDVLYVAWEKDSPPTEPGSMTAPRYVDQPQHEWPAWAAEFISRFSRAIGQVPHAVPTTLTLGRGQPGSEILQFARDHDVDLIVLERRAPLDVIHTTLITAVLRTAPCPVLLLQEGARASAFADREHHDLLEDPASRPPNPA